MFLRSHGLTDPGCRRAGNEDRIFFDDAFGLYVVCDGIGGRRRGEIAAEIATNTIRQYVESSRDPMEVTWPYGYNLQLSFSANRLVTAVKLANRQVWRRSEQSLEYLGMGTTVAAVLADPNAAVIANVGDSRVYLLRGGVLEQLSTDDTVASAYLRPDEIDGASAAPQIRNVLTRAAGSQENVDAHLRELKLEVGDRLLLSSDGLHSLVSDERIRAILAAAAADLKTAVEDLISAAIEMGAPDNVSAVVFEAA
jgi:serine/threonine protein phosphatase PrpC